MIAETDASVIRRSLRHCVRCCSCTPGASSPIRRSPVCSGSRRRPCARGFIGPGPRLPARWASRMTLSQSKRRQPDEERRRSARRRPVTGRARRLGVPRPDRHGTGRGAARRCCSAPGPRGGRHPAWGGAGLGQKRARAGSPSGLARARECRPLRPPVPVPEVDPRLDKPRGIQRPDLPVERQGYRAGLGGTQRLRAPAGSWNGDFGSSPRPTKAAWRASRAPRPVEPSTDGTYPRGAYFDNCNVPPKSPAGLSTAPAQLLRELVQRYDGGHSNLETTFGTVACMLQASGYPPLRAALFRVLECLPGERQRARARPDPGKKPPLRGAPTLPNGTVVGFSVFLDRGVVNSQTALPQGGNLRSSPRLDDGSADTNCP
jgi:hypothetical protein